MELSVRYRLPYCQANGRAGRIKRRKSLRVSPDVRFARTGHSREVSFLTRNGHWHGHRAGGSVPASFPAMNLPISSPTPPNCSSLLADGEHQANRRPDERPDGKIYKNDTPEWGFRCHRWINGMA